VAVLATTDLKLSGLKHVAHHLKRSECRKLLAALHGGESDIANNADSEVHSVSCLTQLKHWNSQLREQNGDSYARLTHELRYLGHGKLADFLSRAVIHHQEENTGNALSLNLTEEVTQANEKGRRLPKAVQPEGNTSKWQTVGMYVIAGIVVFVMICVLSRAAYVYCSRKRSFSWNVEDNPPLWNIAKWKLWRRKRSEVGETLFHDNSSEAKFGIVSSDSEDNETIFSTLER
jgi:hypothetical protein